MFCYIYDDIFIALKVTSICYNYQCCKTFRHNGGITSTVLTIFSKKYLLGWLISTKTRKVPKLPRNEPFEIFPWSYGVTFFQDWLRCQTISDKNTAIGKIIARSTFEKRPYDVQIYSLLLSVALNLRSDPR